MSQCGDDIASINSFSDFDMLSAAVVLFRAFSNKLLIRYHDNIIL